MLVYPFELNGLCANKSGSGYAIGIPFSKGLLENKLADPSNKLLSYPAVFWLPLLNGSFNSYEVRFSSIGDYGKLLYYWI